MKGKAVKTVKAVIAAAVILVSLLTARTTASQQAYEALKEDGGAVVVKTLIPGTTAGNYSGVAWGPQDMCSPGSYAFAFKLKTEPILLLGDFTALNGVLMYCLDSHSGKLDDRRPASTVGRWGLWGTVFMCTEGYLTGVQMRVEQPWQAKRDKSGVNNLAIECTYGERMVGDGTARGQWGEWHQCPKGSAICGLRTLVLPPLSILRDDLSLISAAFYCCLL